MKQKRDLPMEEIQRLLEPGYMPIETGYFVQANGDCQVRALTRMPGCKGKMLDWWFGYIKDTATYKKWHPQAHAFFEWDDKWNPGHYIGATHVSHEYLGSDLKKLKMKFYDPAEIFDTSKFKAANVGAVICIDVYDIENNLDGHMVHLVRDTYFGCELRSRMWLKQAPLEAGKAVLQHASEEFGNLADFLAQLYAKETARK
jgi:hypothetical protein